MDLWRNYSWIQTLKSESHFHRLRRKGGRAVTKVKVKVTQRIVEKLATWQCKAQAGKLDRYIWSTWARVSLLASLNAGLKRLDFREASVPFISAAKVFAVNQLLVYLFLEKIQAHNLIRKITIRD